MINEYVYIDLDGVILDSEHRMLQRKEMIGFHNHHDKQEFSKYFEYTQLIRKNEEKNSDFNKNSHII